MDLICDDCFAITEEMLSCLATLSYLQLSWQPMLHFQDGSFPIANCHWDLIDDPLRKDFDFQ